MKIWKEATLKIALRAVRMMKLPQGHSRHELQRRLLSGTIAYPRMVGRRKLLSLFGMGS
jgi:hypothetical protein